MKRRVMRCLSAFVLINVFTALSCVSQAQSERTIAIDWTVRITTRDGVALKGLAYRPPDGQSNACILVQTPYTAQRFHDVGTYFAANGYTFIAVDARGRGNSEGVFEPFEHEAQDGADIVDWLMRQPYCRDRVVLWGGSYSGFAQWAVAKERGNMLSGMSPTASVFPGVDFPMRRNIFQPYAARWLTYVSGRSLQERIFADTGLWARLYAELLATGRPFSSFSVRAGDRPDTFLRWVGHPNVDSYWDAFVPSPAQYRAIQFPVLTITGMYDDDQLGALTYYRNHMRYGAPLVAARHYLVIGPWDHSGTRRPSIEVGGLRFGQASLVDINRLHLDWYNWILLGGQRPELLRDRVAYYVANADRWRFAASLDAVTSRMDLRFLTGGRQARGHLGSAAEVSTAIDAYSYDPSVAPVQITPNPDQPALVEQDADMRDEGQLIYDSEPFARATEVAGLFTAELWLAIDQPDTDFRVGIYEVTASGEMILLAWDFIRARHRLDARQARTIRSRSPLRYVFDQFNFVAREVPAGSRIRLMVGPPASVALQRNRNSGGLVSEETDADARPVTVQLFRGGRYRSLLAIPMAQP